MVSISLLGRPNVFLSTSSISWNVSSAQLTSSSFSSTLLVQVEYTSTPPRASKSTAVEKSFLCIFGNDSSSFSFILL